MLEIEQRQALDRLSERDSEAVVPPAERSGSRLQLQDLEATASCANELENFCPSCGSGSLRPDLHYDRNLPSCVNCEMERDGAVDVRDEFITRI